MKRRRNAESLDKNLTNIPFSLLCFSISWRTSYISLDYFSKMNMLNEGHSQKALLSWYMCQGSRCLLCGHNYKTADNNPSHFISANGNSALISHLCLVVTEIFSLIITGFSQGGPGSIAYTPVTKDWTVKQSNKKSIKRSAHTLRKKVFNVWK